MPVPPLGFHPSRSISVRRASDLSAFLPSCGRLLFPPLSPSISLPRALRFCSLLRSGLHDDSAQSECPTPGLFSLRSSVSLGRLLHLTQGPRPSWAFPPQGSIPLHPRPSQAPVLSRASPGPSRKIFPAAPQSFLGQKARPDSLEPGLPSRGFPPCDLSLLFVPLPLLGYPSEAVRCYHLPTPLLRSFCLTAGAHRDRPFGDGFPGDRKSTRLNSSH